MTRPPVRHPSGSPSVPENEARSRLLTESLPQFVWTTDSDGVVDYCNRHLLEFCGLTLEEVRAGRGRELIHPDDLPGLLEKLQQSRAAGTPFEHEYRVRGASGEYRWHFARSEPFHDPDGRLGFLGVAIDVTPSKQAEFELRAANERLNGILGSISESFIVLDREWRFLYASRRVVEQTGKDWSELRGRVMWELFPEAARTEFKPGYEKVMRDRVAHTFDVNYPGKDRAIRHYQVHAYPTPDGIAALVSDLTGYRQTEKDLADSRRLLQFVLDSAGVGTWIWNIATGEVTDLANTANLMGLDRVTSINQIVDVVHPEDRAEFDSAVRLAGTTARIEVEYRVIHADGSIHRLRGTGAIVPGEHGAPLRMAGVVTDITDRSRTDEVRNRLAAIVDSSDDAIISKDLNGIVTSWNSAATHLFGYRPEEMIGRSILTIIPPELHSEEPIILASLRSGKKIDHHETVRLRKDGTLVHVSLTISPVRDAAGRVVGASKIARDISERLRLQDAIIQSEKLAATGRMAAAIAHEINNPLEAVTNLAYLINTDPSLSERAKHYSELLLQEINRVSDVAKQSLGFFRDSKKPGPFDVCELLDTVVGLYRPMLDKKGIAVTRSFTGTCRVNGSSAEIRQVFANLIRNAIEAVPSDGAIQLRVRTTSSGMRRIVIADNGSGISPETMTRLFQPFVSSKGAAGNGLGLWVSHGIVKKHGGRIKVRTCNVSGRSGTVFAILLPREGAQSGSTTLSGSDLAIVARLAS